MARDYAGTITLNDPGSFRVGKVIRESGGTPDHGGLDRVARNQNSIYAAWSPTIATGHCSDANDREYLTYSGASDEDLYAYRFRASNDTIHKAAGIGADVYSRVSLGGTTGRIKIRTVNGSGSGTIDTTAATLTWGSLSSALAYGADAEGREIAVVSGYRTAGAGSPRLRALHLHYQPYTAGGGALPSGVQAGGYIANDVAQYGADHPMSAGALTALESNAETLRDMFPWPIAAQVVDLRSGIKAGGMTHDKGYPVQVARFPVWRRPGEGVQEVAYSILGITNGSGGKVQVVARYRGAELSKSTATALPTSMDHTDYTDWIDGTVSIADAPTDTWEPVWIEVYTWATSAGDDVALYSVCLQEEPR